MKSALILGFFFQLSLSFASDQLVEAVHKGDIEEVKVLLESGADINHEHSLYDITALESTTHDIRSLVPTDISEFEYARKKFDIAKFLLSQGAKITGHFVRNVLVKKRAYQPLMLDYLPSVDQVFEDGHTILSYIHKFDYHVGYHSKREDFHKYFRLSTNREQMGGGKLPIHMYMDIYGGDSKQIIEFIEEGINYELKDGSGYTALLYAVKSSHTEVAKYLIQKGADVNALTKYGQNVAMLIAEHIAHSTGEMSANWTYDSRRHFNRAQGTRNKYINLLYKVLARGVDLKVQNEAGLNILHLILRNGRYKIYKAYVDKQMLSLVRELLNSGAEINQMTKRGESIFFHLATTKSADREFLSFLLEKGAQIDDENWKQVSAYSNWALVVAEDDFYSSYSDDEEYAYSLNMVEFLLKKGANPCIKHSEIVKEYESKIERVTRAIKRTNRLLGIKRSKNDRKFRSILRSRLRYLQKIAKENSCEQ